MYILLIGTNMDAKHSNGLWTSSLFRLKLWNVLVEKPDLSEQRFLVEPNSIDKILCSSLFVQ